MTSVQDTLILSSSNQGGLGILQDRRFQLLDSMVTTGLFLTLDALWRGVQVKDQSLLLRYSVDGNRPQELSSAISDVHDVFVTKGRCYVVSTGTNEIVVFEDGGGIVERRRFAGEGDAWHLNCLTEFQGRVVFSAFGEFSEHRGYKGNSRQAGFVRDLASGRDIITGLSQPHTPVAFDGGLLVCNSETRELLEYDPTQQAITRRRQFNGYTRGIAVTDRFIYLGLSVSRNIDRNDMESSSASVLTLDRQTWDEIARFPLPFDEIYDVRLAPDIAAIEAIGRSAAAEDLSRSE